MTYNENRPLLNKVNLSHIEDISQKVILHNTNNKLLDIFYLLIAKGMSNIHQMPESLSNDAEMNAHRAEVDQMEAVDLAMVVSSTKSSTEYSTLKEHTNLLSEVLPTARDIVKKLESDAGLKKL